MRQCTRCELGVKLSKLTPKFVPKLLNDEQKRARREWCQLNLDLLNEEDELLQRIVTGDESWMSVFEVETKQRSAEWQPKGSARPMKAMRQRSERKSMLTCFWDQRGSILAEFTEAGDTVTSESYCELLGRLKENIRRKRPELWKMKGHYRNFWLQHDNASSHTATITLALIGSSNIKMISHPPTRLIWCCQTIFFFQE